MVFIITVIIITTPAYCLLLLYLFTVTMPVYCLLLWLYYYYEQLLWMFIITLINITVTIYYYYDLFIITIKKWMLGRGSHGDGLRFTLGSNKNAGWLWVSV